MESKKVTIFGENTAGATDNLDFSPIRTPSKKYALFMPSFRIKPSRVYEHYESIGVTPDINLSDVQGDRIVFSLKLLKDN